MECVYCAVRTGSLYIILRSAHTVYLCVLCGSQNKQRLFPYTALTDWFYNQDGECLLRATDCIFNCNYFTLISVHNALQDTAFSRNFRASVVGFCDECNRFVKYEPFGAASWYPSSVLCAVVASCRLAISQLPCQFISFYFITHFSACWCSY